MELLNVAKLSSNPLFPSLILLFSLLIWLKLSKKKRLNLPPSPPKLPIIGNIHQVGKVPHRSLRDLSRNYGPLLLLQLGYNPTVLVSSPDLVKEIVKNHDIIFSNRPKTTSLDFLYYGGRDMVFSPYGEYWKQVKKISVLELFSHKRVHSFQFVREEEVEVLINKIRCACLQGESVNLSEMLMSVSSNIASRCILSHKSEDEGGSSKFGQLGKSLLILSSALCIGYLFPYLGWLDILTGYIPSMKALSAEFDAFLDQVIQEHRGLESSDDQVSNKKDFVSIIMQLQKDRMYDMDLTQDNIKGVLLDMFIGGTDTTKATIEWGMTELLKHPNVMKKLQQEVRNVMGNKSKVEMDHINKMKYLKCVIKETLRLHPAAPLLAPRRTSASVKLGGYHIPSNTTIIINGWAIHRDPERWENPEEFIPERFENSSIDFQGQDFHYIPFGFGRRACPGMPFGIASTEYVMANLVYWFDWKLPAGETTENFDMSDTYGITLHKKIPLRVVPVTHLSF
ncbi:Cytochrome P450 71A1 [Hibiscus syriacus]|uniref:Cytochrome P450 71A1 n=1 Tax=Hibiscus syriacus TaxID=106335 RepID=A0A6A2Y9G4_HIBSY|nr:cytochrome P450 71A1-like [Hibiscus syriacus]KAE8670649.1 Cytochrome P450 71A1 [Hibiscus syriacus]